MRPDGTALHKLSHNPDLRSGTYDANWSPDGYMIVFSQVPSNPGGDQHCHIYTLSADGSHLTDITNTHPSARRRRHLDPRHTSAGTRFPAVPEFGCSGTAFAGRRVPAGSRVDRRRSPSPSRTTRERSPTRMWSSRRLQGTRRQAPVYRLLPALSPTAGTGSRGSRSPSVC